MSKHPRPVKKPKPKPRPKRDGRPPIDRLKHFWLAPVLLLSACSMNMIHVDAIADSVAMISERHDAYVEADPALSALEREVYLRDTELLGLVIEEAQK